MTILGSRADGERMAKKFGIVRIGFEPPMIHEGQIGSVVIGMVDDDDMEKVDDWFHDDPPTGLAPGSIVSFKNA